MTTRVLKYLILLAFGLLIVAISSFWFSGPSFRERDVVVELDGPTQISSGEEVTYKLKYENNTRSTLHDLDFVFFYPEGSTVVTDDRIEEEYIEDFKIDELAPGEKGEREFRAFLMGEKGSIRTAKITMSFKSGNLSSTFEKNITLSTTIVSTPIALTLVAPPGTVSDSSVQYILDYRNESGEDVSDLLLEFDYPDGFSRRDSEPVPTGGNNTWLIKSLKKNGGGRIVVNGILKGQEGESKVVSVRLKRKIGGDYTDYQKVSAATMISNPVLGLDVTVNDFTDYSASLGDRLNYTLRYSNNSNINFSGMNLVVKLEGDMLDLSRLDTRGGLFDDASRTITWNSSTVPDFSNFAPNASGRINFGIVIKSSFPSAVPGASSDRFVKVTAKFGTQNVPINFEGEEISVSDSIVTRIGTQPTFNQSVYYNDPNFGSSGPLPPRVGEETMFTVSWQLTNPGNDTDNVKIVGKLSPGVVWADAATASNGLSAPTYNPNTGEVIWSLAKLPYGTGSFSAKYEGSFRVKIKPSSTQRGSALPLIDSAQFTGTDNFTKQGIIINKGGLTTDNLADRPKEGTVQ